MEYEIKIKHAAGLEEVFDKTYGSYDEACRATVDVALSRLKEAVCSGSICTPLACGVNFVGGRVEVQLPAGIVTFEVRQKINDIMDTLSGHNAELVRKINDAWKSNVYHGFFGEILLALLIRDHEEYEEKMGSIEDYSCDWAIEHANEIMQGVCDDRDLETILSFVRYEE